MERAYRNLGYFFLALIPIFVAGFWVPYFSEIPHFDSSITLAVHVHATLLFCFLALLIFQPLAIRYRAFATHRILGKLSNCLMPFILLFSAAMIGKEYREHLANGVTAATARQEEFLSAVQASLLGIMYILSISSIRRRDVSAHMRYMICIALILLPAGLARTLGYWFNVRQSSAQAVCLIFIDLSLTVLIFVDRRRQAPSRPSVDRPYIATLLAYIVIEAVWVSIGRPV